MFRMGVVFALLLQSASAFAPGRIGDAEFAYPKNLHVRTYDLQPDDIGLDNFGGKFIHGGIVPSGGFDVVLIVDRGRAATINEFAAERSKGCASVSQSSIQVGGKAAIKIVCLDNFGFLEADTTVLVQNGQDLYKFFLSVIANEPKRKTFEATFDTLLGTMKFTK